MKTTLTRSIILLLLFFSFDKKTNAQSPDWKWAKSMGSTGDDVGRSVKIDAGGNIYITGYFEGTVDFNPGQDTFNLTAAGGSDIFICKSDSSGNFIWAKAIGGTLADASNAIVLDASANIYATGYFRDTVDFDPGPGTYPLIADSLGNRDIFILKWDSAGNFKWAHAMGSFGDDKSFSIALDASANVYTTGDFQDTVDFNPDSTSTFNLMVPDTLRQEIFVSKSDSAGNFIWAVQTEGGYDAFSTSIAIDIAGNICITGGFRDSNDFDPGPGTFYLTAVAVNAYNIFIWKLDNSGNFIWAKGMYSTSVFSQSCVGESITLDASRNVYLTGHFYNTVDFNPDPVATFNLTSEGYEDIFIAKLDSSGNFIWAKQIGKQQNDWGRSIVLDDSANVYTTGKFILTVDFDPGPGTFNLFTPGIALYVLKLDSAGNFTWAQQMSGQFSSFVEGNSIALDARNNAVVTGDIRGNNSYLLNGCISLIDTLPTYDILVAKLERNPHVPVIVNASACYSYVSPSGNYTWIGSGTFMDTIPTVAGCDSVITVNLTILLRSYSFQTITACNSYTSPSGNYTWTTTGVYADTIPNAAGCDSAMTLVVYINNSSSSTISVAACSNYVSPGGNYVWSTSGTYTDTIPNAIGCDSIITVNLTINNTTATQTVTACNSYSSPSGNYTWTSSGTYLDTIPNAAGCDSIITIQLTINTVNTSVTQSSITLTATSMGATYQWLDCDNGFVPINGATNQSFTTTVNGNFAVAVTQNGCTDTSACYAIVTIGINENNAENTFEIVPNPVLNICTVLAPNFIHATLFIYDITGRELLQQAFKTQATVDLSALSSGVYFVEVKDNPEVSGGSSVKGKLVKE